MPAPRGPCAQLSRIHPCNQQRNRQSRGAGCNAALWRHPTNCFYLGEQVMLSQAASQHQPGPFGCLLDTVSVIQLSLKISCQLAALHPTHLSGKWLQHKAHNSSSCIRRRPGRQGREAPSCFSLAVTLGYSQLVRTLIYSATSLPRMDKCAL